MGNARRDAALLAKAVAAQNGKIQESEEAKIRRLLTAAQNAKRS